MDKNSEPLMALSDDLLIGATAIAAALRWKNAKGEWNTRRVYHLAGTTRLPIHKVPGLGLVCRKTTLDSYFRALDEKSLLMVDAASLKS